MRKDHVLKKLLAMTLSISLIGTAYMPAYATDTLQKDAYEESGIEESDVIDSYEVNMGDVLEMDSPIEEITPTPDVYEDSVYSDSYSGDSGNEESENAEEYESEETPDESETDSSWDEYLEEPDLIDEDLFENAEGQIEDAVEVPDEEDSENSFPVSDSYDTDNTDNTEDQLREDNELAISASDKKASKEKVEDSEKNPMGWLDFLAESNASNLSKEEYISLVEKYEEYLDTWYLENDELGREGGDGIFSNDYLEVSVLNSGRFTIGNVAGNPNYSSDDDEKLLYGHPSPGTSETLISIDDDYEEYFAASSTTVSSGKSVSTMQINSKNILIIQTLSLISSGNASYDDTVQVNYRVVNRDNNSHRVGIRIMLDTMLASNDDAPFRITGTGNVTSAKVYSGSAVPASYQVYDNLDYPTTLATGYLYRTNDRKPDLVQFCNWGEIESSDWNHSVSDGDYLGDSAVGVYFNPVTVSAGDSTSVNTYYGVAVGASISEAGHGIGYSGNKDVSFVIRDAFSDQYISGADVTVISSNGTDTKTTSANGAVEFSGFTEKEEKVTIKVSAPGYPEQSFKKKVKKGSGFTLFIKSDKDEAPTITEVKMGDKDLLNDVVHFIEDANNEIDGNKNSGVIKIEAQSDMAGCTYYFIQNETVLQKNKTGIFEFKTLKKAGGTLISSLSSQAGRYIQCISQDGKKSKKMAIGIKVSVPSLTTSSFLDLRLADFWPLGNAPIADGTLANLFLGSTFKFGPQGKNYKVKIELTDKNTVRVGINLTKMPKNEQESKEFKEAINKQIYNAHYGDNKDSFGQALATTEKFSVGTSSFNGSFYGYGEGQITKGQAKVDVVATLTGGWSGSKSTTFFWTIPVYVCVGGGVQISATGKWNLINGTGGHFNIAPYSFTIAPEGWFSLEGGAGSKGIANIGVEGKAILNGSVDLSTKQAKASLTGEANLKAAIWKFEKTLNLARATVKLYDSNDREGTVYGGNENVFEKLDAMPFTLTDRSYLKNELPEGGDFLSVSPNDEYANPLIINVGANTYKFWIYDDENKAISNGNTLVYSRLYDWGWGDPISVLDDGTSDFFFDVATDGVHLDVVWHNSNRMFDDETVQPDDMTDAAEIYYARITPGGEGEEDTIVYARLTENEIMDSLPAVVTIGNNTYVAWYRTANGVLENEEPNYLCYSTITNMAVGSVTEIDCGSDYISSIKAHAVNGQPLVSYSLNNTDSYLSEDAVLCTLNLISNASEQVDNTELKKGAIVQGSLNGQDKLFWYEDGNVYYADSLEGEKQAVFSEDMLPAPLNDNFIVFDEGSETHIIWAATVDKESDYKYAFMADYRNGKWFPAYRLVGLTDGTVSSLNACRNDEGNLILTYMDVSYNDDGKVNYSVMADRVIEHEYGLTITAMDYDSYTAVPGGTMVIKLAVQNTGNQAVSSFSLKGYDENEQIYEKDYSGLNLLPGESMELDIDDFPVSEELSACNAGEEPVIYQISVENEGEFDKKEIKLGYVNLFAEQEEDVIYDNQICKAVRVVNAGSLDAKDVHLNVLADSVDGALVFEEIFGDMEAGESRICYIPVSGLNDTSSLYAYVTTSSLVPQYGDEEQETYYTIIPLNDEKLTIGEEYHLTLNAAEGGTVEQLEEDTVVSGNWIAIKAVPDEGYVFDCWMADPSYTVIEDDGNPETTVLMPESDLILTAHFVKNISSEFTLSETDIEMEVGDIFPLKPVFGDNEPGKVLWASSDTDVVKVNGHGEIQAVSSGSAVITATCGNVQKTCIVTVSDVKITDISLVYPSLTLTKLNEEAELDVVISPQNASEKLIWESSNEGIVSVTDDGRVIARGYGEAVIRIYPESNAALIKEVPIHVINTETSITLSKPTVQLDLNDSAHKSEMISVLFAPEGTESNVSWSVYGDDVVELSPSGEYSENLLLTAKKIGNTLVLARTEKGTEAWLDVSVRCKPSGISIIPSTTEKAPLKIELFETSRLNASLMPEGAEGEVIWTSSNSNVASVDENGNVEGKKSGKAVITASCGKISAKAYIEVIKTDIVTVKKVADLQSAHPYSNSLNRYWSYKVSGASKLQVTFSKDTKVENYYDKIMIYDASDQSVGTYAGSELAGKTITVTGNTLQIRLKTDESSTDYGFRVTSVKAGAKLTASSVTVANETYKGSACLGGLKVSALGKTLTKGTDYTVTYKNNKGIGKATVKVTGKGLFSGSVEKTFTILPAVTNITSVKNVTDGISLSWKAVKGAPAYNIYRKTESGKFAKITQVKGKLDYTDKSVKDNNGTQYTYAVAACKDTVVAAYNKSVISIIRLTTPAAPKLKAKGKQIITISYKKNSKASGYEIKYTVGKTTKIIKVKNAATVKKKLKKLKKKKKYKVQIRSYKTQKSLTSYSAWSKEKSVKVK